MKIEDPFPTTLLWTCCNCKQKIEPSPEHLIHTSVSVRLTEKEMESLDDTQRYLSEEGSREFESFLREADTAALAAEGFTPEERDRLLAGELIQNGTVIVCVPCQQGACTCCGGNGTLHVDPTPVPLDDDLQ